jgi:Flp pilus assembly protein TadD
LVRGQVLIDKGDPLHALSDFERAVELTPDNPEPYMYRGIAKLKLKKFEDAIADFNA